VWESPKPGNAGLCGDEQAKKKGGKKGKGKGGVTYGRTVEKIPGDLGGGMCHERKIVKKKTCQKYLSGAGKRKFSERISCTPRMNPGGREQEWTEKKSWNGTPQF